MSGNKPVTEKEISQALLISDLMLKNQSLERQVNSLESHSKNLSEKILFLEKDLAENTLRKEWVSKLLVSFFEKGKIPLPKTFENMKDGCVVKVTCDPGSVTLDYNFGLRAKVSFNDGSGSGYSFIFEFKPTVGILEENGLDQFPHFHYGFKEQKPAVVEKPKQVVKKKAEPKTKEVKPASE